MKKTNKTFYKKAIINFGMYPQTIKDNNVTISGTPDENGYYTGSDGEKYEMIAYVDSKIPHHYKLNTGKIFVPSDEMELSGGIILRDLLHLKKKVTRMDI